MTAREDSDGAGASGTINDLVFHALELMERGGPESLDELCKAHPAIASELRTRIQGLQLSGLIENAGPPLAPPRRIGPYRLHETLGEGGMGLVVEATEEPLDRAVAIKLIRPEYLGSDVARVRFEREVRATAKLEHSGIVRIFSVGSVDGLPYFAMERIAGCTLAQALRDAHSCASQPLDGRQLLRSAEAHTSSSSEDHPGDQEMGSLFEGSWLDACLRLVREVAEAVDFAHNAGVLHRDLKPSNVMFTPEGRVVLMDFGLARSVGEPTLTRTGAPVGSLPYTAPERLEGSTGATRSSDIYSLGVLLYEALTLRLPYRASSPSALIDAILEASLPPIGEAVVLEHWDVQSLLEVATARDPEDRYESAGAFAEDITHILHGQPLAVRGARPFGRILRWARRAPARAIATGSAAAALLVAPPIVVDIRAEAAEAIAKDVSTSEIALERALDAVGALQLAVTSTGLRDSARIQRLERNVLSEASALYERILDEGERAMVAQNSTVLALARIGRAECAWQLGDTISAAGHVEGLLGRDDLPVEIDLRARLLAGRLALSNGDLEGCLALVNSTRMATESTATGPLISQLFRLEADARRRSSDLDAAARALEHCSTCARRFAPANGYQRETLHARALDADLARLDLLSDGDEARELLTTVGEEIVERLAEARDPIPFKILRARWLGRAAARAEASGDLVNAARHAQDGALAWGALRSVFADSTLAIEQHSAAVRRNERLGQALAEEDSRDG